MTVFGTKINQYYKLILDCKEYLFIDGNFSTKMIMFILLQYREYML